MLSLPVGKYVGVELLGHNAGKCLILYDTARSFPGSIFKLIKHEIIIYVN